VVGATLARLYLPTFPFHLDFAAMLIHLAGFGRAQTIWTVSSELQFYTVFALLWIFHHRCGAGDKYLAVLILALSGLLALTGYSEDRIAITGYFHIFGF